MSSVKCIEQFSCPSRQTACRPQDRPHVRGPRLLHLRRGQLRDEIPRLQGEIDFLKIQHLSSNEVLSEAQDISARWPDLEPDERRKLVETITERITVGKEEINLEFAYLRPSQNSQKGKPTSLLLCLFGVAATKRKDPFPTGFQNNPPRSVTTYESVVRNLA